MSLGPVVATIALLFAVSPLCAATPLKLNVEVKVDSGKATLEGQTNLPDGTQLIGGLFRKESRYSAEDKTSVDGGRFSLGPFSDKGQPLRPGKYQAQVTFPLQGVQPQAVKAQLGPNYSMFAGPLIKKTEFGTVIKWEGSVTIGGAVDAKADAAAKRAQVEAGWEWRRKNCLTMADTASAITGQRPTAAQRKKVTDDCLAELEADKKKAMR